AKDWPGAHTLPNHIGRRTVTVRRPAHYFDPNNRAWPDTVALRLEMPTVLEEAYGPELARQRIAERLGVRERKARHESTRTGKTFLGARRVLKLPFTKRASSYEVFGSLDPQFSAAGNRVAASAAVTRLRAFKAQYDQALRAWMAGRRDVCFPQGTWWMRVFHGVICGPAP
ncbi:MAG: transposase, partial [Polyangiales bacterium]